jgi:ABC-type multidrug transport system permease subunit
MAKFRLLLLNEFKLARNSVPIHIIAFLVPSLLFIIMGLVLVKPVWEVNVEQPSTEEGYALVEAMQQVGPPVGEGYIEPVIRDSDELGDLRQIISVEERDGVPTAVQQYGLIDNNTVKNLRDRLTAAALKVWDSTLGGYAVEVKEIPWMPVDIPYAVYFGMALLPYAAFIAAAIIGSVLTAQDFEFGTITEYRIAPISSVLVLSSRMVRLIISSLAAVGLLLVTAGLHTGFWPQDPWRLSWILLIITVIASSMGITIGLLLRRSFPAYIIGLILALAGWFFGDALALSSGIGGVYAQISQLTPNHHAVELLFPIYYGTEIGNPVLSTWILIMFALVLFGIMLFTYHRRVIRQM